MGSLKEPNHRSDDKMHIELHKYREKKYTQ